MPNPYPNPIPEIAKEIAEIIEKHFPGLTKKTFDGFGYPARVGSPALQRIEMCLYIELMKAGVFNHLLTQSEDDGA